MKPLIKWVYLAFALSMAILALITLNYYSRMDKSAYYASSISQTSNTLLVLEHLNGLFQSSANSFRNYLITTDSSFLLESTSTMNLIEKKIDSLESLTEDNEEQRSSVEQLRNTVNFRSKISDTLAMRLLRNRQVDVNYFIQLEKVKANYENIIAEIRDKEYTLLVQRKRKQSGFETYSSALLAMLVGFTALIVSLSFFYILRALKKRIYFEKELREKITHLNMINRELENLSHATSHHIQEPLRKIRNFASLLRTRQESMTLEEVSALLKKIESNAASLQTLAQDLVQYANLIQGTQKKECVDTGGLLKNVEDHLEDLILAHKASISLHNLPVVTGIPSQLFILFTELITNAISFAHPSRPLEIRIYGADQNDEKITIIVEDNGQGFNEIYAERIFRLFEKLEPEATGGKGVGLAMCGRIMTNHNGTIKAEGIPGKGARFILVFPHM